MYKIERVAPVRIRHTGQKKSGTTREGMVKSSKSISLVGGSRNGLTDYESGSKYFMFYMDIFSSLPAPAEKWRDGYFVT